MLSCDPASLGVLPVNTAHPAMLLCVSVSLLNVAWRLWCQGQWPPCGVQLFRPCVGCQLYRQPYHPLPTPHACCMIKNKILSLIYFCYCFLCVPLVLLLFGLRDDAIKTLWIFFGFQVSYIYTLAVFEDYLYATHSDPSKGSSSVELLQIHRFNITAESRTIASLGNTGRLRVYHKLTQPKGKGHFLLYMG